MHIHTNFDTLLLPVHDRLISQIQNTEGIAAAYPKMQLMRRSSKLGRIEESDSEDDSTDDNKDESHSESDSDSSSDTW